MNRWNGKQIKRKKATPFKPTRNEINSAVEEYLNAGGKITKIVPDESNFHNFINSRDSSSLADEFLFEN